MSSVDNKASIDEALGEQLHSNQQFYHESARSYGQSVLRGLFLLNGGAAIALLTLIGSILSKEVIANSSALLVMHHASVALVWFGLGLILSVICSGLAYFNYLHLTEVAWSPYEVHSWRLSGVSPVKAKRYDWIINGTLWTCVAVALLSLICFGRGGYMFFQALQSIATR